MKSTLLSRKQFIYGAAGLLSATTFKASSDSNLDFKLAVYNDFPPFSQKSEEGKWSGMYVDVAKRLLPKTGTLSFSEDPNWKRSLTELEFGQLQMLFQISYRKARTSFIDFIGVTDVERFFVLVAEKTPIDSIQSFDELASISPQVIINDAVAYNSEFDQRLADDTDFQSKFTVGEYPIIDKLEVYEQVVRLISGGRYGGLIALENEIAPAIAMSRKMAKEDSGFVKLKALKIEPFGESVTYVGVSKRLPIEIRDQIHENYAASRSDGSLEEIWNEWNPTRAFPPDIKPGEH